VAASVSEVGGKLHAAFRTSSVSSSRRSSGFAAGNARAHPNA